MIHEIGKLMPDPVACLRLFGEFSFPVGSGTNPVSKIGVGAIGSDTYPFAAEVEHPLSFGSRRGVVR